MAAKLAARHGSRPWASGPCARAKLRAPRQKQKGHAWLRVRYFADFFFTAQVVANSTNKTQYAAEKVLSFLLAADFAARQPERRGWWGRAWPLFDPRFASLRKVNGCPLRMVVATA